MKTIQHSSKLNCAESGTQVFQLLIYMKQLSFRLNINYLKWLCCITVGYGRKLSKWLGTHSVTNKFTTVSFHIFFYSFPTVCGFYYFCFYFVLFLR